MKINGHKVKIIVSDLDGTLIPFGSSELSQNSREFISRLSDQKVYFVLNTGNLPLIVEWVVDSFTSIHSKYTQYFIGNNGTILYNFAKRSKSVKGLFENSKVKTIVKILQENNVRFNVTDSSLETIYFLIRTMLN